jgi:ABC-type transport system involved in multi-copper enzyme maturation permease subunit
VIGRVALVAAREWREQLRQPMLLAVVFGLFAAIGGLVVGALWMLDVIARSPQRLALFASLLPAVGLDSVATLQAATGVVVAVDNWLVFTQYLGVTGVIAGHALLHDRHLGTMPFLLLAPIRRGELLLGKVLGALGPATALYLAVNVVAGGIAVALPVTAPFSDRLPSSPAWWVALVFGGPAWAAFVCTVCAVVGAVARDVRSAQQAVWFVMFFMTFAAGYGLAVLLPGGAVVQAVVAAVGVLSTGIALEVGRVVLSRDLAR